MKNAVRVRLTISVSCRCATTGRRDCDSEAAGASLYSTVHGAGPLFGPKEAKRRFTRAEMDAWLRSRGVMLVRIS